MVVSMCPIWFFEKTLMIDFFSMITLFLVAFFSYKMYKVGKSKKPKYLAFAFFTMAVAFIFEMLTNLTIFTTVTRTETLGMITFTHREVIQHTFMHSIGMIIFNLLMLFGLYLLYTIYEHKQTNTERTVMLYLVFIASVFSQYGYIIYNLTALLFLSLITFSFVKNYKKQENTTSLMIASSFGILSISQLIFVFSFVHNLFYVVGELIQLAGYVLLLISLIMVLINGKKKKQNRHHR